jgi:hypothetical protein
LIAVLGALYCLSAFAAPYPTNSQLRTALGAGTELLAAEGMTVKMLDAQAEGLELPLFAAGLNLDTGVCVVFYNSKPEDGLTQFFGGLEEKDMPLWLSAIAVHEATHCVEQREAYLRQRFDKVLPADIRHDGMTVQGYLSVVKSGAVVTWAEALADIASLLYLKRAVPERWIYFAQGIADMRHDFAGKWPGHDTSAWLNRVIAANAEAAPNQSIFEAAFQLRRRFKPGQGKG